MKRRVLLDGKSLSPETLEQVARGGWKVTLSESAKKRMNRSRAWVERAIERREVVYGVTTGFGAFQNVSIPPEKLLELQRNLILSHCAGVGPPFPEDVVRAMMLLRANALARGLSGIRVSTVELLLSMLNKGILPVIPSQGSVGASGDLAPLSHMAAAMMGEGKVRFRGREQNASTALRSAGLRPLVPEAKEGLALNNGTQAMTAIAALALVDAEHLADMADAVAALSLEALKGKSTPFAKQVHEARPHPGQGISARNIRTMIRGSRLIDSDDQDTKNSVQDSYSLRCTPQVHGASRDAMDHVRQVIQREMNSATDNPLIFVAENQARSAGNFHGQPVALAMDFLSLALSEIGNISERRTAKMMDRHHNAGLPAFLAPNGGVQSALMIAQYTAAALVSENKVLTHPASSDSIPTSANQEDHVSMGTISARHASQILRNVQSILAIELLSACQALGFRSGKQGTGTAALYRQIRRNVRAVNKDRMLSDDIKAIASLLHLRKITLPFRSVR
ncbi:MAG: histidine ammonia-lyase [Ignavibacteria bacterium]|nr:histidine ammonia-lyase [Ignavibacteria bacterium]